MSTTDTATPVHVSLLSRIKSALVELESLFVEGAAVVKADAPEAAEVAEAVETVSGNAELVPLTAAAEGAAIGVSDVVVAGSVPAAIANAKTAVTGVEAAIAAAKSIPAAAAAPAAPAP